MMSRLYVQISKWWKLSALLYLLSGCAALPLFPALSGLIPSAPASAHISTSTTVSLSKQNYKIIKVNASGSSSGFSFLGLIPFKSPTYHEAISRLYESAGFSKGKAQALVNVELEHSSSYFILFSLPKDTVRADVIEFIDNPAPVKQ
jgi:hypothetical protein